MEGGIIRNQQDRQLTNTSFESEAGPSNVRHLVGQERNPPITLGQSDLGPSNPMQATIGEPLIQVNNTGSSLPSSPETPERRLSVEELQKKLDKYRTLLREYEHHRDNRGKEKQKACIDSTKSHQKKISCYHEGVLEEMLVFMEQFNAKGFVYGMVSETNKPMTGASDSLRAWWKREVMFDKAAPANIEQYYKLNYHNSNVADTDNKSTNELLNELSDPTLGSILSLLMQRCDPPQRKFPFENGIPPPWWPTGQENWWGQTGISINEGPPPFRKPHDLKKKWKVALLITIIKLMCPNFSEPHYQVNRSNRLRNRMSAKERKFWTLALIAEAKQYCQNHPSMPADAAIAFLMAHGSGSNSQIGPNSDGHEAPHSSDHVDSIPEVSAVPHQQVAMSESIAAQYSPWAFSHSPTPYANLPTALQQSQTTGASGTSGNGLQYHYDQAIPYPPFVQHWGDMSSTDGTEDAQNQQHENGER